ncbi:microtubule-associated protein 1 [Nymphaea thermarum]|nr:microtubule-associated protein 1 [Nymphaea thermarum]
MSIAQTRRPPDPSKTTCASLLEELQRIWDEIGENDVERDKMLLQLEQECLDVYRRKVDQASKYKVKLHQELADAEKEAIDIISALGDPHSFTRLDKPKGSLKEQMSAIDPLLKDLRHKKEERAKEFSEVQVQIISICGEISGNVQLSKSATSTRFDERDLTWKRLAELKAKLEELRKDKNVRLQKLSNYLRLIHELSAVMSLDFLKIITEVHPSLGDSTNSQPKSMSNETLARLAGSAHSLTQLKQERLQKLQDLGSTLVELWNLMDIPKEERKRFDNVARLISASVDEVVDRGVLAIEYIEQVEVEVERLDNLKASKMKELILKKQDELEQVYKNAHMDVDTESARQILISIIDSGSVNLSELFVGMDDQIKKAKEEALSRKDILERLDKWTFASEEENWLEDYERDQNRYSAGRGAHKNLKRAEKARILISKMPSMLEALKSKVNAWEKEKGEIFLYDKAPLSQTLEEFSAIRLDREEEKRKSREQKKQQEQLTTEQEMLFGSRPSPIRTGSTKKTSGQNSTGNTPSGTQVNKHFPSRLGSTSKDGKKETPKNGAEGIPINYVALPKDDSLTRNPSTPTSP